MSNRSVRFSPSAWTEKLVPVILAVLVALLIGSLVVIGLSLLGVTPSA
ncbi:MAG: hypothetical protein PHQ36_04335 [Anaerolineales bacterium]|nr:hypothetical protein [Anaerolineales bacterium]